MASTPKPKREDPATIASSVGESAKKQQELNNRKKGAGRFYSDFRSVAPPSAVGGGNQTVG
tara:strand:+ start:1608 stop:1790 length:183 start_codon:yes stop_codon:yes gene_type:complete